MAQELFTFLHTGGSIERIEILPLVAGRTQEERAAEAAAVCNTLLTFDASRAKCFKLEDKHRLLALVEIGYGSLSGFNREVKRMVKKVLPSADALAALRLSGASHGAAAESSACSACSSAASRRTRTSSRTSSQNSASHEGSCGELCSPILGKAQGIPEPIGHVRV